jgi:hypothetical protein
MSVRGPYKVVSIVIYIDNEEGTEGTDIIYCFVDESSPDVDESKLYATKEEAEAVCKAFNDEQPTEPEFGLRSLAKSSRPEPDFYLRSPVGKE